MDYDSFNFEKPQSMKACDFSFEMEQSEISDMILDQKEGEDDEKVKAKQFINKYMNDNRDDEELHKLLDQSDIYNTVNHQMIVLSQ
jgi:hypothetical protein